MVGGDENSTRDMGEFVDGCDQIQQAISSAVLIVHHVSKYGNLERGNSSLRAACDAIISITADDELITIESSKTKDESPFPTRYLKLLPVALDDGGESRVLIPAENVRQTANDPLSRQRRKVLSVLALADFDQGASATDIAKQTGIPEPSTRTAMSELFRLGYVSREMPANSKAYIYRLNDAGRAKLNEGDQNKSGDPQADQSPSSPSPSKVIGMIGPSDHKRQSPTKHTPQDSPDHIDHMDQDDHTDQLPIEDNTDYYRAGL
jgi:DNA-binding MarR family transcriptional regulator